MSFAQKMARRCVSAARQATHEAVRLRRTGMVEAADVAREFAKANIQEAKRSKCRARQLGEWADA